MPRPVIDLGQRIRAMLRHVEELPVEADSPLPHYNRTSIDLWNSLQYVERAFDQENRYQAVAERHLGRLNAMILVNLIETFERFLKEIAAIVIDHLAYCILDERFDEFPVDGSQIATYFGTDTVGKALCESSTWLNCQQINQRFRKLLADPFKLKESNFFLFPGSTQAPEGERHRLEIMNLVWQIRHTVIHNVGVITQSDAIKLQLLAKQPVDSPRLLMPTRDDVRYLKRFLDETAFSCNRRIGIRLAALLGVLHQDNPQLFDRQEKADKLSLTFGFELNVAGMQGVLPQP